MFKVVVDATAIRPKPSGIGLYVYNLINELNKLQVSEKFELNISFQPSFKNWLKRDLSIPEKLRKYSDVTCLPIPVTLSNILAKYPNPLLNYFEKYLGSPDIIHGTDHFVYPARKGKKVMSIADLTFIKYPEYVNSIVKTYTQRVKQCLKWTDLVITISESSKRDIVEYLGVEPDKVRVTYLGSRYPLGYLSDEKIELIKAKTKYDFSQPYLLFVSTLEPRKNINGIITAFNYLKHQYKIEHRLVLIGQKGWKYEPIFASIETSPWRKEIIHLDYLSDEQVALFYTQADIFLYPSIYEGFGLPVLEAMTFGTPVITSNTSSIPEVAGDAALLINPEEPMELAEAILQVISDAQLRQNLREKGKNRAQLFSWQQTAINTLNAYRSLLQIS